MFGAKIGYYRVNILPKNLFCERSVRYMIVFIRPKDTAEAVFERIFLNKFEKLFLYLINCLKAKLERTEERVYHHHPSIFLTARFR